MTESDAALRKFAAALCAADKRGQLAEPETRRRHLAVVREGSNPDAGPIPDEACMREFVAHLFNRKEAFYEPPLPDPRSGE